jgi:uncharacterized protein (TIRG00374 family)
VKVPGWQFVLGAVIAVLLLALSLRGVDLASLGRALSEANYWLLIPASLLTLLAFYIRAVRWGVLLRSVKVISNSSLFSATMIGFAANNLLPARLGELVRAWAIWRQEQVSRSAAFATVVVERVVDVFSLLFFFGLSLLLHPFPVEARRGGYLALGLNLILLVLLLLAERYPQRVAAIGRWLSGRSPQRIRGRVQSLFENFVTGLGVLRQGGAIALVVLYSLLLYAVTLLGIHTCLMAFDFATPWYAALVLLVTTTLGFIIAPTPGYVGSIQVACVWSLALFGVPRSEAFSFSLFYHATQFVPITAVGLWFLARQGLSLNQAAGAAGKEVNETVQC